jgi:uncharacterized membrane protein
MAKNIDESFIIKLGVEKGIDAIIKKHPRFKGRKKEIFEHIDLTRLKERAYDIYQNLANKKMSEEKRREYIIKELSDYVSTGIAFDDEGKEIIILKGLEEKAKSGFIRGYSARKMWKGEQYLDRGLALAHNLSYIMESGDYTKKMPEIAEAASVLEDMRLLDPLIKAMRYNGSLDEKEYRFLQNKVYEKTRKSEGTIKSGIEKYFTEEKEKTLEKIAASILAIFGISLIIASSKITGAVIGISKNVVSSFIGIFIVFGALLLFSLSRKKD